MRISVCMITKNEEKNIVRSITSYKDIVDEIIVVDSESTDDTVRLALSLGAVVYTRPWTKDFSAARNYAIEKATGEWVIIADADEYWENASRQKLVKAIQDVQTQELDCISVIGYERPEGTEHSFGYTSTIRILANNGMIRYVNKVHEKLVRIDGKPLRSFQSDAFVICHTGYRAQAMQAKMRRNLAILEEQGAMQEEQDYHYFMAECCFGLELYEKCLAHVSALFALPAFMQHLYGSYKIFRIYHYQINIMLRKKNQYSESAITRFVREAVEAFGKHPEIRLQEAFYNRSYYRIEAAIRALEEAFRLHENYAGPYENDFAVSPEVKYTLLIELYRIKNDRDSARRVIMSAYAHSQSDDLLGLLFALMTGMSTSEKQDLLKTAFPALVSEGSEYLQAMGKITQEAWQSGHHDLYAAYILVLLQQYPQLAAADHSIFCRSYLLQGHYAGVLEVAKLHEGEAAYDKLAYAAAFLLDAQAKAGGAQKSVTGEEAEQDFEKAASIVEVLLQIGQYERAKTLVLTLCCDASDNTRTVQKRVTLAGVFERFGRWSFCARLFLDAARSAQEMTIKGAQYINAARVLYLTGKQQEVLSVLDEALAYALPGNHLPIEILMWLKAASEQSNAQTAAKIERLLGLYEAQYDKTYDRPLQEEACQQDQPSQEQLGEKQEHVRLSACMITKNEEKNIARSLQSYANAVDEMIVVDSESTDHTVTIAESFGARVFTRPWTNDFAAAKNYAIEQAKGEWIIFLDADEYFEEGCAERLREVLAEAELQQCGAIIFQRCDIDEHTGEPDGQVYVERIFKRDPAIRYAGRIHETLQDESGTLKRFHTQKLLIYHTGYQSDVIQEKIKRNLAILQEPGLVLTPAWRKSLYLAENYYALAMHQETLEACCQVMREPDWDQIALSTGKGCKVYVYRIAAMLGLSGPKQEEKQHVQGKESEPAETFTEEEIETLVQEAVTKLPRHPEIKYMQYLFLRHFERIDEAIDAFHEALRLNQTYCDRQENMFAAHMDMKYTALAQLYRIKNDTDRAQACLQRALLANPDHAEALLELLLLRRRKDAQETQSILESVLPIGDPQQKQKIMQAAWLSGSNQLFAIYFLQLLKEMPAVYAQEKRLLCKVYMLQRNFEGILALTGENPADEIQACFAFIAKLALGRRDMLDQELEEAFFLTLMGELLGSDEKELLGILIGHAERTNHAGLDEPERQAGLGRLFERYGWYEEAERYFQKAAHGYEGCTQKKDYLILAARMAYCAGAYAAALDSLDQARAALRQDALTHGGGHVEEELRKWIHRMQA